MSSVKRNFVFSLLLLAIGLILLLASLFNILSENALGSTVFGIGVGFTSSGIPCSLISYRTLKNPSKLEMVELNENDERNIFIREKTNSKVYSIFIYIESIIIIIASLLGYKSISLLLSFLVLTKLFAWFIVANILSKKY